MKIQQLGWAATILLGGVLVASGFQGKTEKVGVVDLQQVFNESDYRKVQDAEVRTVGQARQDILQFLNTYPVMTTEQATRFKDLSLKPQPTAPEKAELEKLKGDIIASDKKFKDLQTKTNPTAEEVALLREYSNRVQSNSATLERWMREFEEEFSSLRMKLREATLKRVQEAVREVGQKQGYTIIYVTEVVPYAANDVTAEALKAMNAKK